MTALTTVSPQSSFPSAEEASRGTRMGVFAYGVVRYAIFFLTFLYAYGFILNVFVPRSINGPAEGTLWLAVLVNSGLLGLFAVQHSVMARPGFKLWWTRFVPPPAKRATYTLFSSVALILLFALWRPMGGVVWSVEHEVGRAVLIGLCSLGFLIVLESTFLINHFDLFGLRQVWLYLRKQPYTHLKFQTPGPYKMIRHPLYLGWLMAFWFTPTMTLAHLLFALLTTAYIIIAIQFEERDLQDFHGEAYADYRRRVPMLFPRLRRRQPDAATAPA